MRNRKALDDELDRFRQSADRKVNTGKKPNERTDDRACRRERIGALEKGDEKEHHGGIGNDGKKNEP